MVRIKPFRAVRPPKEHASEVASRPYDQLNSAEAKAEATERSLLHIIKPEIDFDPIADEHSQEVYDKAVENFRAWRKKGWLEQDPEEYYYIYAQTMDGRTQYGLTMCCNYEDYLSGAIKKHELTRPDKEEDRMIHVRNQKANIEPVFFAYPDNAEIDAIVAGVVENNAPEYDFTAADGFGHKLWVIRDRKTNDRITEIFKDIPALYVADGHHRTAAAARVGQECQRRNPDHTGHEEYCYFLAVTFPAGQLRIIDYNRVVKDLNGLTSAQLLEKLAENFTVEDKGAEEYRPSGLHNFSMYLDGRWYSLTAKPGTYDDNDPIGVLDVTVLSNLVLDRILDIKDLRTSKRIDFVGGIRGLPGSEAYCSSKAAVISYLESLRNDVRKYGISVTTICPGFVRTPLVAKNPYKMPFILEPEEFAERAVKAILDKDSYRVIPWQMAWVARLLKILPDSVFDWALSGRGEKPRAKELGL